VTSIDSATTLAGHFVHIPPTGDPFWASSAKDLVALLILAAAVGGEPITMVADWMDHDTQRAVEVLASHGHRGEALKLADIIAGPDQTYGGVLANARTATGCLRSPDVAPWVTPHADLPVFDPAAFVHTTETLYLLAEKGSGTTGPLVAAFVAETITAARKAARDSPNERLDPPMVAVLDEAANIVKIADLPYWYSHLGSQGIVPITILQNRSQARNVWGDDGLDALWSASTIKVIGPGIDEAPFTRELSELIGSHEVPQISVSKGGDGRRSETTTLVERPLIAPAQIRELTKYRAILFGTGMPPIIVKQTPWYEGPHAKELQADLQAGRDE